MSEGGILPENISGKAARIGNSARNSNLTGGNLCNAELSAVDTTRSKPI
jgi:hypothetical protein